MWRAKAGLAARPRSGLVGLLQIGLATDVVGGPVCGFTRATGTFRRQGLFQTRAGEREQDVECCARGVRGCFLPVVVPKAAPLVVLSLLFQRHRKTEVSEKERPLALREMVPLFAAGSAHTYSRRPRSTPAAAAHLVACRGRWRKAAAATTLVGQARPAALREKQKGPAKTPPPRGGRGHRRLEAKDGGGTLPLGPTHLRGSARLRQTRLKCGSAGCSTRRPAWGLAPRTGHPKDGDQSTSVLFGRRGSVEGTLAIRWAGPLGATMGAGSTPVRLVGLCLSSGSYLWFRHESGSAVEQTLAVPARVGEQWRGLENDGVEARASGTDKGGTGANGCSP